MPATERDLVAASDNRRPSALQLSAAAGYSVLGSHGPTIRIDGPFLYLIRDRDTGAILFIGHVVDPTLE